MLLYNYAAVLLLRLGEHPQIYGLEEASIRSAVSKLRYLIAENSRGQDDHPSRVCAIINYPRSDSFADSPYGHPLEFHPQMRSYRIFGFWLKTLL